MSLNPATGLIFRYILRQVALPLIFFTSLLTAVIWLTQSLEMLDLVLNRGQSAGTFLYLTILVLPSLLTLILPIALLCGVLYGLHRLKTDSEIVVLWSAGAGTWRITAPVWAVALAMTGLSYYLNLNLMPASFSTMKQHIHAIKNDLATSFVRPGAFVAPAKGLTVYVREAPPGGDLLGIFVHDNRKPASPVTYLADRAVLVSTPEGPRLVMENGSIQRMENRDGRLQAVSFERTPIDLSEYIDNDKRHNPELNERYLGELLHPEGERAAKPSFRLRLYAEAHNRLASPLYNLAFAGLALVALLRGNHGRRGYIGPVLSAFGIGLAVRALGFAAQSLATGTPALNLLQYALPLGVFFACAYLLSGWHESATNGSRRMTPKRMQGAAPA